MHIPTELSVNERSSLRFAIRQVLADPNITDPDRADLISVFDKLAGADGMNSFSVEKARSFDTGQPSRPLSGGRAAQAIMCHATRSFDRVEEALHHERTSLEATASKIDDRRDDFLRRARAL